MMRLCPVVLLLAACPEPGSDISVDVEVVIDPASPTTEDDLVALATDHIDPNSTLLFEWSKDGAPDNVADTIESTATRKGQVWTVVVWPEGAFQGDGGQASVTIANTPPTVRATLSPESPKAGDDLEVTATGSDVDSDVTNYRYEWSLDGRVVDDLTDSVVPASRTESGDRWEVTVWANDGEADSEPVVLGVTVDNRPPIVEAVEITPAAFRFGDTLNAEVQSFDLDDDPLTHTFTWYINDVPVDGVTGESLEDGQFRRGDVVHVEVVANDGSLESAVAISDDVITGNTAPTVAGARVLVPEGAFNRRGVTCQAETLEDIDGDKVTVLYRWLVDGAVVSGASNERWTLNAPRDSEVTCEATPYDGFDRGSPIESAGVLVENTKPTMGAINFSPSPPKNGDRLTASVTGASDIDPGDVISFKYAWEVNGSSVSGSGGALDLKSAVHKDLVRVTVTPNDGVADGNSATTSITLANTAPTAPSKPSISPSSPRNLQDLKCVVRLDSTDADKERLTYSVEWYKLESSGWLTNKTSFAKSDGVTNNVMPYTQTLSGQTWQCRLSVTDGTDTVYSTMAVTKIL